MNFDTLTFELFASIDHLHPCILFNELKARCKRATDALRSRELIMAWITKNIYVSGFTLYVGPYRRVGTTDTDRAVNLAIKQHLIAALLQGESTSKAASVRDLLLQIENLDKKLAKRIVAAVKQNVLQLRHVEYYVKIAQRPDTRNPSACVQKVFWVHIAERFPHQEARITIETQVDPYIN